MTIQTIEYNVNDAIRTMIDLLNDVPDIPELDADKITGAKEEFIRIQQEIKQSTPAFEVSGQVKSPAESPANSLTEEKGGELELNAVHPELGSGQVGLPEAAVQAEPSAAEASVPAKTTAPKVSSKPAEITCPETPVVPKPDTSVDDELDGFQYRDGVDYCKKPNKSDNDVMLTNIQKKGWYYTGNIFPTWKYYTQAQFDAMNAKAMDDVLVTKDTFMPLVAYKQGLDQSIVDKYRCDVKKGLHPTLASGNIAGGSIRTRLNKSKRRRKTPRRFTKRV